MNHRHALDPFAPHTDEKVGSGKLRVNPINRDMDEAAALVKRAGFDMLLVHAGHGWLLEQFGYLPATGTVFIKDHNIYTAEDVSGRRILSVRVKKSN